MQRDLNNGIEGIHIHIFNPPKSISYFKNIGWVCDLKEREASWMTQIFGLSNRQKAVATTEMGKTVGRLGERKDRLSVSTLHMQLNIQSQAL